MLSNSGVMAEAHAVALGMLCNSLASYINLLAVVTEQGAVTTDRDGNARRNPATMILSKLHDQVLTGLREFGLTPAALGKVRAMPKQTDDADDMETILRLAGKRGAGDE